MPFIDELLSRMAWSVTPDESAVRADLSRTSWTLPPTDRAASREADVFGPELERIP